MVARKFAHFLGEVEHGHAVQIIKHGRVVARLVSDCDFMEGKQAAALFVSGGVKIPSEGGLKFPKKTGTNLACVVIWISPVAIGTR